jgi:hypothetical protein
MMDVKARWLARDGSALCNERNSLAFLDLMLLEWVQ